LIVVAGFLADHESSRMVSGIEPFASGRRLSARTSKPHPGPHFHEWPALGERRRLLIFDPDQRQALIVLEDSYRTDRNLITSLGLADSSPVSGRQNKIHHQNRGKDHGSEDEEGFSQDLSLSSGLSGIRPILSTGSVDGLQCLASWYRIGAP